MNSRTLNVKQPDVASSVRPETKSLIYISHWQNTLHHSQKLEFFRTLKSDLTTSNYLDVTRGTAEGKKVVKLRISNQKLMIELGRYNQTTRNNRNCPFCGSNPLEHEVHFLFNCSQYSLIRTNFYSKVKVLISDITQLPVNVLINEIMNTSNNYLNITFMNYISACFDFRDELLKK